MSANIYRLSASRGTNTRLWQPPSSHPSSPTPFRLHKSGVRDHFYTTSTAGRVSAIKAGYVLEGTEGYVYSNTTACGIPLYRGYRPGAVDHFYTVSAAELEAAVAIGQYVREWIAAYVPQASVFVTSVHSERALPTPRATP